MEPRDKEISRPFPVRKVLYVVFGLVVILALLVNWWVSQGDISDRPHRFESPQLEQRWHAMFMVQLAGGCFVSDTKLLFYDSHASSSWRIYETKTGEITDGSGYARAYGEVVPFPDPSVKGGWLTGWKGNIVFSTHKFTATNHTDYLFEWRRNSDKLETFKAADFSGGNPGLTDIYGSRMVATTDGWLFGPDPRVNNGAVVATGSRMGPVVFTNAYPSNLTALAAWPFEGGLYVVAANTNKSSTGIFVWSWKNQALITSNLSVKVPRWADVVWAEPDPAGKRVVWTFVRFPRVPVKLLRLLPVSLARKLMPGPKQYFYTSDLQATQFRFVCATSFYTPFIWGFDGESIWLPDPENGLTRHDLK